MKDDSEFQLDTTQWLHEAWVSSVPVILADE